MNEAQREYVKTFYALYEYGRDVFDWTDDEFNGEILERAKSMRSNVDSLSDERFAKQEWIEIFNDIISGGQ